MKEMMQGIDGYKCWRVTGELSHSIDSCPEGSGEECLKFNKGLECKSGYKIVL